jgi:hypothetical protein
MAGAPCIVGLLVGEVAARGQRGEEAARCGEVGVEGRWVGRWAH